MAGSSSTSGSSSSSGSSAYGSSGSSTSGSSSTSGTTTGQKDVTFKFEPDEVYSGEESISATYSVSSTKEITYGKVTINYDTNAMKYDDSNAEDSDALEGMMHYALPGGFIPSTRQELATVLWTTAGKPDPVPLLHSSNSFAPILQPVIIAFA